MLHLWLLKMELSQTTQKLVHKLTTIVNLGIISMEIAVALVRMMETGLGQNQDAVSSYLFVND